MVASETMAYPDLENSSQLGLLHLQRLKAMGEAPEECCTDFTFRVTKNEERQGNFDVHGTFSLAST